MARRVKKPRALRVRKEGEMKTDQGMRIRLDPGSGYHLTPDDPVLECGGNYLWIGNGPRSMHGQWCFATVSILKAVPLAREILQQAALIRRGKKVA